MRIDYKGFSGGLSSVNSGEDAKENQLQEAVNCMIVEKGIIRKRYGASLVPVSGISHTDFIIDCAARYGESPSFAISSCHDKKIYGPVGSLLHTYTIGGIGAFVEMTPGILIHSNGKDPAYIVDTVGAGSGVALGCPLSRQIFKHNDRVFAFAGGTLYETEVGTFPSATVDYFATGASWNIDAVSDYPIIGLGSIGRNLIIFTSNSIYIQVGYTQNERQTYLLSSAYGCRSTDSIKSAKVEGLGDCVIFLSDKAKLCIATMSGIIEIGESVQDILDSISFGTVVNEKYIGPYVHRARGCILDRDFYLLGFATTANDTHDAFNQAICMSLKYPYQSDNGIKWPITLWKDTGRVNDYTGICNTSRQTFGALNDFGNVATTSLTASPAYTMSTFDKAAFRDWQGSTNFYWIDYNIKTRNEFAGSDQEYKQWAKAFINATQDVTSMSFELYITQDCDYEFSEYLRLPLTNPLPVVYKEIPSRQMSPGAQPIAGYLYEFVGELVNEGIQNAVVIENYEIATAIDSRIHSVSVEYTKSHQV